MGIYIKDMKLPKDALACPFRGMTLTETGHTFEFICDVCGWTSLDTRCGYKCPNCPLVEIFLESQEIQKTPTDFNI